MTPKDPAGWWVAVAVILLVGSLLAAALSQIHLDRIRLHVDKRLEEHHQSIRAQIKSVRAVPPRPRRRGGYAAAGLLVAVLILMRWRGKSLHP